MPKTMKDKIYRVMDANFNRTKEGLRVCEDVCRFVYDERSLTRRLKMIRHDMTDIMKSFHWKAVIKARDMAADVGKRSTVTEMRRKSVEDMLFANLPRVKESVRVLAAIAKLMSPQTAEAFKKLRYRIYAVERVLIKKFSFS
jgi:thiamine-phosphate pyrophosphorylase